MKIHRSCSFLFVVCVVLVMAVLVAPVTATCPASISYIGFNHDYSSGNAPLAVQFTPVVTSVDPIQTCVWDFGDGTPAYSGAYAPISHTYTVPGTYDVTLTVFSYGGCTLSRKVTGFETVNNVIAIVKPVVNPVVKPVVNPVVGCVMSNPDARFTESPDSSAGVVPYTVHFTDQSTGAKSWNWNFGDGSTSAQQNPDHTYTTGSTTGTHYLITLTITGSCTGESDSYSLQMTAFDNVGLIAVNSNPSGALITYDGKPTTTKTPFIADGWIPIGIHAISLKLDGYDDYFTTFMVEKGKTAQVNAVLVKTGSSPPNPTSTTGSLQITSIPSGAAVYIDEGSQGTTPVNVSGLAAGSYTVKLTKSGYTDYQQPAITVAAGKTTPLNVNLVATTPGSSTGTGSISIISSPSGASVNLDGWDKGTTPTTLDDVKAGSHTLTLTKTGYQDSVKTVPVTGGNTTQVTASLTIQDPGPQPSGPGTLTIRSTPVGANVYIDGETAGITPVKIQNVKAGTHKILLTLQSYPDTTQTVEITAGSDKEISIDLGTKKAPGFAGPASLAALAFVSLVLLGRRKER